MRASRLPDLTFVRRDGAETLHLSQEAERVVRLAARLSEQLAPGSPVGLIFRSGPELVLWWLAALHAGLRPLVMQYPTVKQSQLYWQSSVRHTIEAARLAGIVCDSGVRRLLGEPGVPVVQEDLPEAQESTGDLEFDKFSIIQLSSGTTGHRKAVEFTSGALARHAADYQQVMQLDGKTDMIVSWLPLYHDMGYVACFVMPLMLGIPITMIDPEVWVRDKSLLFEAIDAHRGTICYMPNFGFEVMAREPVRDLSSMRLWISCSEPVKASTTRRFLEATGTPESKFAACYAMAENIFAVSQSSGLKTQSIDGQDVASCGPPIPGVELKTVDGEIWVRSPTSLQTYLGGAQITDPDGFYPTGDLGEVSGGELYVTGRKRDLMIQAGKKFMLSDVDAAVNEVLPEAKGRVAALAEFDARLGTQRPIVLVEAQDFYTRTDGAEVSRKVLAATGLDNVDIAYVPPKFLTKTSSGKINRVLSLEHWHAAKNQDRHGETDWRQEVRREFALADFTKPVSQVLDSLSQTVLAIILGDAGLSVNSDKSLEAHLALDASVKATHAEKVIRIVSLADRRIFRRLTEKHVEELSHRLGTRVILEHVCLPPSPILLSDLVFDDYFSPRWKDQDALIPVRRCLDKLRSASVVLMDDAAEFHFPVNQVYPVLSHRLERSPKADLVATRWQRYAEQHHLLPVAVVAGSDLPLSGRDVSVGALFDYLKVPAFRIASAKTFEQYTRDWEYRVLDALTGGAALPALEPSKFIERLSDWIAAKLNEVQLQTLGSSPSLDMTDLAHFCSHFVDRSRLDLVLERYQTFCIAGRPSSVPYVSKRLREMGKEYFYVPSYAPRALQSAGRPFECVLCCGAFGNFPVKAPAFPVMSTSWGRFPKNVQDPKLKRMGLRAWTKSDSNEEWYSVAAEAPQASEVTRLRGINREHGNKARAERLAARRRQRDLFTNSGTSVD